jgi:aspartate carbamoyltransferase catalytic subunit
VAVHIISTKQFLDRTVVERIFSLARASELPAGSLSLSGKILACLFYEPSTRTRFSFESAMHRLGGTVISSEQAGQFSSAIKGETLEDSVRIVGGYANAIVLRHPDIGAARRAANVSEVPVINAGDGAGEHPTQALLDLYTIREELGRIDDLHVCLAGDLRYGRTIHSLIYLLSLGRNIRVTLVSPEELMLPEEYKQYLDEHGMPFVETNWLGDTLGDVDVLYMTRVQKERFESPELYEQVRNKFVLAGDDLVLLNKSAIIMHPLPRVNEIAPAVDADPRAAYFRQARNGLPVRMALLQLTLAG